MTEETKVETDSGSPHDGPGGGGSSQDEPGSADPSSTSERVPSQEDRDPDRVDSNEKADDRATVVEPGGEDLSPRA